MAKISRVKKLFTKIEELKNERRVESRTAGVHSAELRSIDHIIKAGASSREDRVESAIRRDLLDVAVLRQQFLSDRIQDELKSSRRSY